ncbi:MAG: FeS assembly protein SufD [Mycobacterium sp.]|nr:FeS assembly protein SufD [Mycobacterium sp.]
MAESATREFGGTSAAATAGPGKPLGGPGVRTRTGSQPRVFSRDPDAFPVPNGREEEWRFTPLKRLRGLLSGEEATGELAVTVSATGATTERIPMSDPRVGRALVPSDRVTALSMAAVTEALLVSVLPNEADAHVSIEIKGGGGLAYGHLVIDVGHHAHATVVLDHVGSGTFGAGVEVVAGDGCDVTVVSLQDWADDAVHAGAHAVLVGRDARYRHVVATLGGDLVRLVPTVVYAGPGGDAELFGLSFTDAGQHHEHRLFIDHGPPRCRSRVVYKSALQGDPANEAHAVWIGDVLIRSGADGTDTYELNRNLVLSDGARADSVPNLEIETGEVIGAGHASATGRFDDVALFYLMSRGIPADVARRLVVRSFFAEVLAAIPFDEVRDRVAAAVDEELARYHSQEVSA